MTRAGKLIVRRTLRRANIFGRVRRYVRNGRSGYYCVRCLAAEVKISARFDKARPQPGDKRVGVSAQRRKLWLCTLGAPKLWADYPCCPVCSPAHYSEGLRKSALDYEFWIECEPTKVTTDAVVEKFLHYKAWNCTPH